jgi:type IV pilus assembly protein PilB
VRFRVDGELREITQPPIAIKDKLASRIKVISRLDIAEKRVPQDGRMKLKFGNKSIDFRVSTLPTLFGEKIVIRILDSVRAPSWASKRWATRRSRRIACCLHLRPYGMVLVTGPTGSGKTVSLYTCLNILNQPGVNISTVEDPAEINLPGINQVNVNDKAGLNFSAALKSFLRQDPDVIMVGEIRDLETADIAIKAAQTGHMVMSTLHTNDAPTDADPAAEHGRRAVQHRVQRAADHRPAPGAPAVRELQGAGRLSARGDAEGRLRRDRPRWHAGNPIAPSAAQLHNGYKGRVGIYQVMPISEEIQRIILSEGTRWTSPSRPSAKASATCASPAWSRCAGVTTLEEVIAATNE